MTKTIIRRLLILIPQMLILTVGIFILAQFMPGDVLAGLAEDPTIDPQVLHEIRLNMGLYDPWYVQYFRWIGGLAQGDWGRSWANAMPTLDIIAQRAGNSVRLGITTFVFTYLIAVPGGVIAGKNRDKFVDKFIVSITFLTIAMPTVIMALINLFVFSVGLGWFPMAGSVNPTAVPGTFYHLMSSLRHMFLPALTGAFLNVFGIINILRNEVIDNENADYVTTARAKGVPSQAIYRNHVARNASLPIVATVGLAFAGMITGSIFIEQVFSFPGLGQLFISSITLRDFPVVNALVVIFAFLLVGASLFSDILITVVDPRIRIK